MLRVAIKSFHVVPLIFSGVHMQFPVRASRGRQESPFGSASRWNNMLRVMKFTAGRFEGRERNRVI
jgi:hypothetical protein